MDSLARQLGNCNVLSSLASAQLAELSERCRLCEWPRQSRIYGPHDVDRTLFLLAKGRVRLSHITATGKQSTVFLLNAGELFGELAVCDFGSRDEYCETVTDSAVIEIPAVALRYAMRRNSDLSLAVTDLIGLRRRQLEHRLDNTLFRSTQEKLMLLLFDLSMEYGIPVDVQSAAVRLDLQLTHQDLGSMIGTTRETVSHTLGILQKEGLVTVERQCLTIHDPEKLRCDPVVSRSEFM